MTIRSTLGFSGRTASSCPGGRPRWHWNGSVAISATRSADLKRCLFVSRLVIKKRRNQYIVFQRISGGDENGSGHVAMMLFRSGPIERKLGMIRLGPRHVDVG